MIAALLSVLLAVSPAAGSAPPARAERILSPRSFPGWQATNVAFPFVLFDAATRRYRMLYAGSPAGRINSSTWEQWVTLTATSRDGRSWDLPDDYQPVLYAHRFREGEVADPRMLAAQFDSVAAFGVSALREAGGYRLWYTGWAGAQEAIGAGLSRDVGYAIGTATSSDGGTWTKQPGAEGAGAVLAPGGAGAPDVKGAGQPSVIRDGGVLRMWYECLDGARWRICAASSTDGLAWSKEGVAIDVGGEGAADAVGVRNPVAVRRGDAYEVWYQAEGATVPRFHVMRARSADRRSWTRTAVALHEPVAGDERIHVDSVIARPDGSEQVFFAREVTRRVQTAYGPIDRRSFHIYTEAVRSR
jgi:hypothetical protein